MQLGPVIFLIMTASAAHGLEQEKQHMRSASKKDNLLEY